MRTKNPIFRLGSTAARLGATMGAALLISLPLSGCGAAYTVPVGDATSNTTAPVSTPTTTPVTSTASASTAGLLPDWTGSFQVTGNGGTGPYYTTAVIHTDNIMQVEVTAGPAGQISVPAGSAYCGSVPCSQKAYSCISYAIRLLNANTNEVIGAMQNTQQLSAGSSMYGVTDCPAGAPTSQILDFSEYATTGHPPFKVQVLGQYTTDDYQYVDCIYNFGFLYGNCAQYTMKPLYYSHTATGTLTIRTSTSVPLQ